MANSPQSKNSSSTSNRGFASMDSDRQREIASQGGKASHGSAQDKSSNSSASSDRASASDSSNKSASRGVQGGTPEQHAAAGRQSHKNDSK